MNCTKEMSSGDRWTLLAIIALGIVFLLTCGCGSSRYVEGTNLSAGLYIPTEASLVGVQVLNYLNGVKVSCGTNSTFTLNRTHAVSNSYFGCISTVESTHTEVSTKK